jgi:hypothetical protein
VGEQFHEYDERREHHVGDCDRWRENRERLAEHQLVAPDPCWRSPTIAYAASVVGTSAGIASMYSSSWWCLSASAAAEDVLNTETSGCTRKMNGMITIAHTIERLRR